MLLRSFGRPLIALGVAVAIAACGGSATAPPQGSGGTTSSLAPSAANPTSVPAGSTSPPAAGGADRFEGSFKTSGLYAATWTVAKDVQPNPFNSVSSSTVTSDKGTFGNIHVKPDGSLSFGSGETGFSGAYNGTGAKVTLDASGQFVCAFTVDTDLTGTNDKAILHITGGMTVHWRLLDGGEQTCP